MLFAGLKPKIVVECSETAWKRWTQDTENHINGVRSFKTDRRLYKTKQNLSKCKLPIPDTKMSQKNKLQLLQNIWQNRVKSGKGFDQMIYQKVRIVAGGEGTCEVEFQVEEEHTNPAGLLHGGFSACLVDSVSTLALLTHPRQVPGVSVNLNMTYLKAAKIGDHVLVKAAADKVGKNLAFLNVQIINKQSGAVLAQGSHTKYIL